MVTSLGRRMPWQKVFLQSPWLRERRFSTAIETRNWRELLGRTGAKRWLCSKHGPHGCQELHSKILSVVDWDSHCYWLSRHTLSEWAREILSRKEHNIHPRCFCSTCRDAGWHTFPQRNCWAIPHGRVVSWQAPWEGMAGIQGESWLRWQQKHRINNGRGS
jgi:hypothetical protein